MVNFEIIGTVEETDNGWDVFDNIRGICILNELEKRNGKRVKVTIEEV